MISLLLAFSALASPLDAIQPGEVLHRKDYQDIVGSEGQHNFCKESKMGEVAGMICATRIHRRALGQIWWMAAYVPIGKQVDYPAVQSNEPMTIAMTDFALIGGYLAEQGYLMAGTAQEEDALYINFCKEDECYFQALGVDLTDGTSILLVGKTPPK